MVDETDGGGCGMSTAVARCVFLKLLYHMGRMSGHPDHPQTVQAAATD